MENKEDLQAIRVAELTKEIQYHNYQYNVLDDPQIPDVEYDMLFKELQNLEKERPDLLSPTSPTQRVGGEILSAFEPAAHINPMLSLDNAFTTLSFKSIRLVSISKSLVFALFSGILFSCFPLSLPRFVLFLFCKLMK